MAYLDHPSSERRRLQTGGVTTCSVVYEATSGKHLGTCALPTDPENNEPVAGSFAIRVLDADGNLVSGSAAEFDVTGCPPEFFFHSPSGKCAGCPRGATCAGGKQLPVPEPGYWSDVDYAELGKVYPCEHTANCRGGASYDGSCWFSQESVDECQIDLCHKTALGPLCGRCKFDESPRSYSKCGVLRARACVKSNALARSAR